MNPKHIKSV
jgi:regulator of sirC expression with transglutaminase-like and TPR domain